MSKLGTSWAADHEISTGEVFGEEPRGFVSTTIMPMDGVGGQLAAPSPFHREWRASRCPRRGVVCWWHMSRLWYGLGQSGQSSAVFLISPIVSAVVISEPSFQIRRAL
jgi:hypothetical protein